MSNQPDLTEDELEQLTVLLKKLTPGFLPFAVFHQITRLTTTPIIEVVPLRLIDGKVEVLLLKRAKNDPVWPDKLHVPGTVIRSSDTDKEFRDAFNRILNEELKSVPASRPVFVTNILHHSGRGIEASQIFWIEVSGEPSVGQFYTTDDLPKELVNSQLDFIPMAVEHYLKYREN